MSLQKSQQTTTDSLLQATPHPRALAATFSIRGLDAAAPLRVVFVVVEGPADALRAAVAVGFALERAAVRAGEADQRAGPGDVTAQDVRLVEHRQAEDAEVLGKLWHRKCLEKIILFVFVY